ncbi:MAG: hypothetical protein ABIM89_17500 [Mycobacteriales bacterium]
MSLPSAVALNAWTGVGAAEGELRVDASKWGSRPGLAHSQQALPFAEPVDPADWAHRDVGYGVLLPDSDDPTLSAADKAAAKDAPAAVRDLLAARPGTPVVRWRADLDGRFLRRYFEDGSSQDPTIGLTKFGVGKGRLPRYLVIVGGPDVVPWSVQYALSTRHCVGRLPLADDELGNYVDALLSAWATADVDVTAPVVWDVDHGGGDITTLMRTTIAAPLAAALADPRLPGFTHITGAASSGAALLAALRAARPALLVTSSHGRTGPLDDAAAMRSTLGLPVDAAHADVALADLDSAVPAGAIWYSQACCSAGCDSVSHYTGLLAEGSTAHGVVSAVAGLGATVAPAASALLGRAGPVRAVLGHVEPTFDWTLRVPETGQGLGHEIVTALSSNLHFGQPIGLAFAAYREGIGELHTQWAGARQKLNAGDTSVRDTLTRLRLTAIDRQSLVLLGDPTVTLPALPGG